MTVGTYSFTKNGIAMRFQGSSMKSFNKDFLLLRKPLGSDSSLSIPLMIIESDHSKTT